MSSKFNVLIGILQMMLTRLICHVQIFSHVDGENGANSFFLSYSLSSTLSLSLSLSLLNVLEFSTMRRYSLLYHL